MTFTLQHFDKYELFTITENVVFIYFVFSLRSTKNQNTLLLVYLKKIKRRSV